MAVGSGSPLESSTAEEHQRFHSLQSPPAVRERRTPEQVRTDASTRVSRLQAALDTLTDGDVEEKRALQLALTKAQKQAEELPLARQIQVTKDFVDRVRKRMPAADEKIRLAQVALEEEETRKSTTFANSLWPKLVWNGSRRRLQHDQHQAPHLQLRISKLRFNGCVLSWRKCRLPRHRSAHRFVSRCVERKGFQTSRRIHRDDSFRSTGPRQMYGGQTHGTPGRD